MNLLKLNLYSHVRPRPRPHHYHRRHHLKLRQSSLFLFFPFHEQSLRLSASCATPLYSFAKYARTSKVNNAATSFSIDNNEEEETEDFEEYLAEDGEVYQKTLRLVECAMFAAVSGLAFLLSNSLAIEKYFACFFALPIVLSTMRWGIAAGRKTMVATAVLLFVLSGPVKAITYLVKGKLGCLSLLVRNCTISSLNSPSITKYMHPLSVAETISDCDLQVRATGALGNVVIASYLIGENILALITINVHALVTYILSSMGIIAVPSMNFIYFIFGFLLLLNCGFFVFLLHLLYAIFFTRLGMKASLRLPKWLEAAI